MDQKEENYGSSFPPLDYSLDHHHHHHHHQQQQQQHEHEADIMKPPRLGVTSGDNNNNNNHHGMMIDYMLNNPHHHQRQQQQQHVPNSFDKLCFADVMQFADFGPKLSLNQTRIPEEDESGLDPVYFLKFPVLNEKLDNHNHHNQTHSHSYNHPQSFMVPVQHGAISISNEESFENNNNAGEQNDEEQARVSVSASENNDMSVQLRFMGEEMQQNRKSGVGGEGMKTNKRKRTRSVKTSEEVESQRMTHIAVERNRRKQMNEHLRVLRSLMPGSYVQRGDQASIIGGAIEFVRELEQLLQCLESQKRRRLLGESPGNGGRQLAGDSSTLAIQPPPQAPLFPPAIPPPLPFPNVDLETGGLREETAENKSCLADVEVKVLGFDAMIKILSRRRPGQLIKAIAALEDLQLNILHTNITTIEQTVLYSFNVKVANESRFSAEDIANSVQQIFTFIHGSSSI